MWAAIQPAHGDVWDEEGRILSRYGARAGSGGETNSAHLTLYDQSKGPSDGSLNAGCVDTRPWARVELLVETAHRWHVGDTGTLRIRVDRNATRRWEVDISETDFTALDERPASFGTYGEVPAKPAWGLIAELVGGKRMIAQIGALPVVTLDLDTAKPDIVRFHDACERMWRNILGSPRVAADFALELVDEFGEGLLWLDLFHGTFRDGGPQAELSVWCENGGDDHGVNVVFVSNPPPNGTARLGFDSETSSQLRLLERNPRTVQLDLPDDATVFLDRLATARTMTLELSDMPTLRFDLGKGRPEIADFRAKCRTLLGMGGRN